jgi:hypothetical protein
LDLSDKRVATTAALRGGRGDALSSGASSIAAGNPMGIGVEMLSREFEQFAIFERDHLVDQPDRNIHALPRFEFEFVNLGGLRRLHNAHQQPPFMEVERFSLELVKVQRASLALVKAKKFAAIKFVIGDPDFTTPALLDDVDGLSSTPF